MGAIFFGGILPGAILIFLGVLLAGSVAAAGAFVAKKRRGGGLFGR